MRFLLRKCTACGRYTLRDSCPLCGSPTRVAHPHRFSPIDKYAALRLRAKREGSSEVTRGPS
ncbi:MAG: RNA-protein complex protein Nop10 [Fervidicoccaceae archaeon]